MLDNIQHLKQLIKGPKLKKKKKIPEFKKKRDNAKLLFLLLWKSKSVSEARDVGQATATHGL